MKKQLKKVQLHIQGWVYLINALMLWGSMTYHSLVVCLIICTEEDWSGKSLLQRMPHNLWHIAQLSCLTSKSKDKTSWFQSEISSVLRSLSSEDEAPASMTLDLLRDPTATLYNTLLRAERPTAFLDIKDTQTIHQPPPYATGWVLPLFFLFLPQQALGEVMSGLLGDCILGSGDVA